MWVKKKKIRELEKRIADLEVQVQSQQEVDIEEKTQRVKYKLEKGLMTLNQARDELNLMPLQDELANKLMITM